MGAKIDVIVGHDVGIGDSAILMPGIEVGADSVIGAGSVVTKTVLPYLIVCGTQHVLLEKGFLIKLLKS